MKDLRIKGQHRVEMKTKNGILNEENVDFIKRTVLFNALREHKDLVKYKMEYPNDEVSDVKFTTDFMILSIDRYMELLALSGETNYKQFNK